MRIIRGSVRRRGAGEGRARWLPAALAVLALVVGGAPVAAGADRILRIDNPFEPESLDPAKTAGNFELQIASDLFEGLTTYGPDGSARPGVAERWTVSSDGRVWTFFLRTGLRWSDGTPLTAADFVYSFRRQVAPATASPNADGLNALENAAAIIAGREKDLGRLGVTALDADRLEIRLVHPVPLLPDLLASGVGLPAPRSAIERSGDAWTRAGNLVSNGPYTLKEWTPQAQIVLSRNPLFHDADEVAEDEVHWVVTEDDGVALKRYRSGELDVGRVPPSDLVWAQHNLAADLHLVPLMANGFLTLNQRGTPFAGNLKLRQALSLAIDRVAVTDKVDLGGLVPANGIVPPGIAGYHPQRWPDPPLSDPDRVALAQRLFAESGARPGLRLTISYSTDRFTKRRLLAIASMWKDVLGVETTLVNREWQVFRATLRQADFQIANSNNIGSLLDPLDLLSAYRSTIGELNAGGYVNPAFDHLLDQAEHTVDISTRMRLLESAERLVLADQPNIPLFFLTSRRLVSRRIEGWQDNLLDVHPSRYLSTRSD